MAAVIGPVRIQHPDLRHGRIPLFFFYKIILNMQKIFKRHGKIQRTVQFPQCVLLHLSETVEDLHVLRLLKYRHQRLRLHHIRLPGIHRIDAEGLDGSKLFLCHAAFDHIDRRRTDHRLLRGIQKLHALHRRIRSLIKLSRQIFHAEDCRMLRSLEALLIQKIHRRLAKHGAARLLKGRFRDILHIITNQHPNSRHRLDPQIASDLVFQFLRLDRICFFLFHKDASYHAFFLHLLLMHCFPALYGTYKFTDIIAHFI